MLLNVADTHCIFVGTPLGCIGVLLVFYYMRCCHTSSGMLLGLGGIAEKTPLPCVAVCGTGREEPWRHYLKEPRITRTICRKSSSWCSWGFLVLSCFAEKLWSQAVISRDNSADFFGKSRNRWGLNAAATAVEDDDKDSVAAMLHRQLRIYKGGSPEEPVWFPDIWGVSWWWREER